MPKAIPDGYHTVTPYLALSDAAKAIEFYKAALGATELFRLPGPGGKVMHAELQIGTSRVMMSDESPDTGSRSAKSLGGSAVGLMVYLEDVDAAAERFVKAGGKVVRPVENQFYGDRTGTFEDPEGYRWMLATNVEEVAPEEMSRRLAAMARG